MILKVLQDIVGFCAGVVTMAQMFSGVFLCKAIRKKGSTKGIPSTPFLGGLIISLLLVRQSRIIVDSVMLTVNVFGALLSSGYLAFFYYWTKGADRIKFVKRLQVSLIAVSILIFYSLVENQNLVEYRYGMIVTGIIFIFMSMPLLLIPEVIRKRSSEALPYPMIVTGVIVSLNWLLYSILIWNKFLIVQNIISSTVCLIQMYFLNKYPDKTLKASNAKVKLQ